MCEIRRVIERLPVLDAAPNIRVRHPVHAEENARGLATADELLRLGGRNTAVDEDRRFREEGAESLDDVVRRAAFLA